MLIQSLDDQVSLAVDNPADAQAIASHLRADSAWLEVVAGIDTVVVRFDALAMDAVTAQGRIEKSFRDGIPPLPTQDTLLEIPIVYGGDYGPDLGALCEELGFTKEEFIALHTGTEYRVDTVGFTPGFVFVGGLDERLHVPRRTEPRQCVAAGSVGIADGRTGLYALASPGGWTLIGRTSYTLFNARSDNPFPIEAGMRIRFTAISADEFES
ncbi:MAG: 5-oxoprolinase subunit PxpB [Woeseiaceae bacterium]